MFFNILNASIKSLRRLLSLRIVSYNTFSLCSWVMFRKLKVLLPELLKAQGLFSVTVAILCNALFCLALSSARTNSGYLSISLCDTYNEILICVQLHGLILRKGWSWCWNVTKVQIIKRTDYRF